MHSSGNLAIAYKSNFVIYSFTSWVCACWLWFVNPCANFIRNLVQKFFAAKQCCCCSYWSDSGDRNIHSESSNFLGSSGNFRNYCSANSSTYAACDHKIFVPWQSYKRLINQPEPSVLPGSAALMSFNRYLSNAS